MSERLEVFYEGRWRKSDKSKQKEEMVET